MHTIARASYQICKIAGCACAGNVGNVFPATDIKENLYLKRSRHASWYARQADLKARISIVTFEQFYTWHFIKFRLTTCLQVMEIYVVHWHNREDNPPDALKLWRINRSRNICQNMNWQLWSWRGQNFAAQHLSLTDRMKVSVKEHIKLFLFFVFVQGIYGKYSDFRAMRHWR